MDKQLDFLLNIKLYSLQRSYFNDLTFEQLKEVMFATKWQNGLPEHLYQIAADIEELNFYEVANYFTKQGKQLDYNFNTLEGGTYEEK
jgi:hypothetical protein